MNSSMVPVLIVDDERNMLLSLQTIMRNEGYENRMVASAEEALEALKKESFFMIISDARLGGMSGYELLEKTKEQNPDLPFVLITAYATPKLAVDAIKAGATDYLAKPFAPEELLHVVSRCAERHKLLEKNQSLREKAREAYRLDHIIGESPPMVDLRKLISKVARSQATVLILGESGTGKELIAGALHNHSERSSENYVCINCAAIPDALLESELFGHQKGAFTGAIKQKLGRVEEADGGTIFLDEIGDMSRSLQAKLLRFLEDGTFTRIGGNQELRVDVRVVAATNQDIIETIKNGQFREDLFHRLNVVQFRPPPLRERGEDVMLLANHFLKGFNVVMNKSIQSISEEATTMLNHHLWPGNIRELRNAIERAVILESSNEVQPSSLPDFRLSTELGKVRDLHSSFIGSLDEQIVQFESEVIQNMLEKNSYNQGKTAEDLKISRHALRYRMQRSNIPLRPENQ
jgi:DNA-binding NtrC family response regulator